MLTTRTKALTQTKDPECTTSNWAVSNAIMWSNSLLNCEKAVRRDDTTMSYDGSYTIVACLSFQNLRKYWRHFFLPYANRLPPKIVLWVEVNFLDTVSDKLTPRNPTLTISKILHTRQALFCPLVHSHCFDRKHTHNVLRTSNRWSENQAE